MAHKKLGGSNDFVVVGTYPRGQEGYDMCHGKREERRETDKNIVSVPLPESDPLYGSGAAPSRNTGGCDRERTPHLLCGS